LAILGGRLKEVVVEEEKEALRKKLLEVAKELNKQKERLKW